MNKKNITFTYKFYVPICGGIERLIELIAKSLAKRGFNVKVITLNFKKLGSLSHYEVRDNVTIFRIKTPILIANQIDIGIDSNMLEKLINTSDIVHVFSSIPSCLLIKSLRLCRKTRKICIWQPTFIPRRFRNHKNIGIRLIGYLWDEYFLSYLAKYVHGIVALTGAEAEFFRKKCPNLVIDVLGECVEEVVVDQELLAETLAKYGLAAEGYVLSVGRLAWYKGYDLLLDAWRFVEPRYPWLKLVIVGSDWGYKRAILERVRRYGLRNVVLLEALPSEELHALYEGSLFVAQLSRFETFHRVALEAWGHRKPIVALDLGPATEHIASDRGILVRDDVGDVVKAFETLINDDGLRRSMGLRGYEVFREKYNVESYVDRLLELYRRAEEVARG